MRQFGLALRADSSYHFCSKDWISSRRRRVDVFVRVLEPRREEKRSEKQLET